MRIAFHIIEDEIRCNGKTYPLLEFRKYMIKNHPELVQRSMIKSIVKAGKIQHTFDWLAIIYTAKQYGFDEEFLQYISGGTYNVEKTEDDK